MDFSQSDEHRLLADAVRAFVERELWPHEAEVERLGEVPIAIRRSVAEKARAAGFFALNMPAALGGGGLDHLSLAIADR